MARLRIVGDPYPQGGTAYRQINGNPTVAQTQTLLGLMNRDECTDELGRDSDHACNIRHEKRNIHLMNGKNEQSPTTWAEYSSWVPTYLSGLSLTHESIIGIPSAAADATKLLARTNPGRAEVSLPVFIGELRDLPHMVKSAGDFLLKRRKNWFRSSAGQYLSWQFGWKPLMNDLRSIVTFQASVDARVKELERLYSKGGLKRRMKLGTWGQASTSSVTMDSVLGTLVNARQSRFTQVERWGTVRWKPTVLPPSNSSDEMRRQAVKAVFGLSIQAVDVWNLMPWSWLVDWCTNMGDFLEAHANRIPAAPGPVNIMTKRETSYVWTRTNPNWVDWPYSSADLVEKQRYVGSGVMSATLGFLSPRQMSILGALAVTRAKGSHRYTA